MQVVLRAISSRQNSLVEKYNSQVGQADSAKTETTDTALPEDRVGLSQAPDLTQRLRAEIERLQATDSLKELYSQQGLVKDRKQERWANASFELALDPAVSPQVVKSIFQLIESDMADPDVHVVRSKELGGGMNNTRFVVLSNGLRAVWKPSERPFTRRLRRNVPLGTQDERDGAAYLVDKKLGHLAKIPPTVIRELDGEPGVLTFYVGNSDLSEKRYEAANIHLFEPEVASESPVSLLDVVIGNLDRHRHNWLISRTEEVVPIDHDLTFPERNGMQGWVNYNFHRPLELDTASRERLENFLEQREEVAAEVEPLIGKRATGAMFRRVKMLLSSGETGTDWLGNTRFRKQHASDLGYLTSQNYPIGEIPGISSRQSEALEAAGISDSKTFLEDFATPQARSRVHFDSATDLANAFTSESLLDALNKADLMRITGVGPRYAEVLHEAGVDTVPELAGRNVTNLTSRLKELTNHSPSLTSVKEWVRKANLLRRRLSY